MSKDRNGTGPIGISFVVSALSSVGLAIVYALGGSPQLEGILLSGALGGIAVGMILWGHHLMPGGEEVQARDDPWAPEASEEVAEEITDPEGIERRSFLVKALGAAAGALGIAALFPIRSLGQRPGNSLYVTSWRAGLRLVTSDSVPVLAETFNVGDTLTVFPEGHVGEADAQTVLLRIDPEKLDLPAGREDWVPDGFIAYSRICTHAGCPVGLYEPLTEQLFCPCHQSLFDAAEGARPIAGPATRPLPQLPLKVDEDGFITAGGDFSDPAGPAFWDLG